MTQQTPSAARWRWSLPALFGAGLGGLAAVASVRGQATWGAPLLAAADSQIAASGAAWWPADRVEVERTRRHLREALGDAEFDAAWARGRALGLDAAIAYATAG